MLSMSLKDQLNYETEWMSREAIVYSSYEAVRRLVKAKGEVGMLPRSLTANVVRRIDEAVAIMHEIDDVLSIGDPEVRRKGIASVTERIRGYNRGILSGRSSQLFPVETALDQRWFDEFEFKPEIPA